MRLAHTVIGHRLERAVFQRRGHGESALAALERAVRVADAPVPGRHRGRHAPLPRAIAQPVGELFRVAQHADDARELAERYQRAVQVEAQVDAQGDGFRVSGRWLSAASACSTQATASAEALRAVALRPSSVR